MSLNNKTIEEFKQIIEDDYYPEEAKITHQFSGYYERHWICRYKDIDFVLYDEGNNNFGYVCTLDEFRKYPHFLEENIKEVRR